MIESFSVSNFKSLQDISFTQMTPITLLAGRNNVGKSTVLEAIFSFFDRYNPQIFLSSYGWRGVPTAVLTPESMWAPTFLNYDLTKTLKWKMVINGVEEEMSVRFNPKYTSTASPPSLPLNPMPILFNTDTSAPPASALEISCKSNGDEVQKAQITISAGHLGFDFSKMLAPPDSPRVAIINLRAHENQSELARRYGELDIAGQQENIVEFVRIIEPRIKSLSVIATGDGALIHADTGIGRKLPVPFMGDGVSRLLSIIIFMATSNNGAVMIDEIESGIHYAVMPKVWEALAEARNRFDCQIIATTHSYECLQAAKTGLPESHHKDFSFIRLDQKGNKITPKRFDYELFSTAIDAEMEIR